jgi:hypothetical protein
MPPLDHIDTAERIVRLETKLDFLITQIEKLPPSPTCLAKHKELEDKIELSSKEASKRITTLEAWRNKAVGAMLIINILVVVAMEKILNFFGTK